MFSRSAPAAVAVEVNPGVELGRTTLHVDGERGAELAHLNNAERDTVLVVIVRGIVGVSIGRVRAVGLHVARSAQRRARGRVLRADFRDQRGIELRCVSEVDAQILVPGDLVVVERRREDVEVTVAVHVGGKDAFGAVGGRADDVGRETAASVVLVPGDRIIVPGSRGTPSPLSSVPSSSATPSRSVSGLAAVVSSTNWPPRFGYQATVWEKIVIVRKTPRARPTSPSASTSAAE